MHITGWHYFEPDPERDQWLNNFIEICHQHAILVYVWIELPHVSEKFWNDHPEWREKTAVLSDAHLDWRKLMNLQNPDCVKAIQSGLHRLISQFNWDGVNLGELYFESLEGHGNPTRFTPFNDNVRKEFQARYKIDPVELFTVHSKNKEARRAFLNFRTELTLRMQQEWIRFLSEIQLNKNHLDLVLTHVDDQFDPQMKDLLGADAKAVLPLLEKYRFTFLVEDPATVWHLGPQRYPEIAAHYAKLTRHQQHLAVDINIVERYQNVYPTKQQTGVELFQLVHLASKSFERVALYFENSILPQDLDLLAAASSTVTRMDRDSSGITVEAPQDVLIAWKGPAKVNGKPWPLYDGSYVRIPAGIHRIEQGEETTPQILDVNARVIRAEITEKWVLLEYESPTRAIVRTSGKTQILPAGRHTIYLMVATS